MDRKIRVSFIFVVLFILSISFIDATILKSNKDDLSCEENFTIEHTYSDLSRNEELTHTLDYLRTEKVYSETTNSSTKDENSTIAVGDLNIGSGYPFILGPEICDDGIDNDGNGLTDCEDPAVWGICCIPAGWEFGCDDNTCVELQGVGIKENTTTTMTFTDPSSIQYIIVEATYDGGGGYPETVNFAASNGNQYDVNKNVFENGNEYYYQAYFKSTSSITLTHPSGTNATRAETYVAYVFRDCMNQASAGSFVHRKLYSNEFVFSLNLPSATTPRDVEITVPLSEITNDGRIVNIVATAGPVVETITISNYNEGNSLNITPFTLENVPGNITSVEVQVISPGAGLGQSLYLSGAGSANTSCLAINLQKTANTDCAEIGETIIYTYVLTNVGDSNLSAFSLVDDKLGTLTVPVSTLTPGASTTVTATHTVTASDLPGPIVNIATASATEASTGQTVSDAAEESVTLMSISVDKTVNTTFATVGDEVTYSYEITNDGSYFLDVDLTDDKLGDIDLTGILSDENLLVLYNFTEGTGSTITDAALYGTPLNLTIEDPGNVTWNSDNISINSETRAINTTNSNKIWDAVTLGGTGGTEFTVEAWVQPSDNTQGGPTRIIALSENTTFHNFILGQEGDEYEFRIRTTDELRNIIRTTATPISSSPSLQHVVFTYDGHEVKAYVNGNQIAVTGDVFPTGDFSTWDADYDLVMFNEAVDSRGWTGQTHLTAVYNTVLTAGKIAENYAAGTQLSNAYLYPGNSVTVTETYTIQASDLPNTLTNIATVTGTNESCSMTDTDDADVDFCQPGVSAPSVTVSASDNDICEGETVTLTAVGSGGTGTLNYLWSHGASGAIVTVTPSTTTTYSVTVTDSYGCTDTDQVVVNVTSNFSNGGTIGSDQSSCANFNPANIANITSPSSGSGGTIQYLWQRRESNGSGGYGSWSTISGATGLAYNPPTISITTQYRRLARRLPCTQWQISNVVSKIVNTPPVANAGTDESTCSGISVTLGATATGGSGSYSYAWNNGGGSGANVSVTPTSTTTYTVTVTDSEGCTDTDQVVVTVTSNFDDGGTIGTNESSCSSFNPANITNIASPAGGTNGTIQYLWQNRVIGGSWSTISGATGLSHNPLTITVSMQYRRIARRLPCTQWKISNIVTHSVNTSPTVNAGADIILCAGETVNLSATASGGNNNYTYTWDNGLGNGSTKTFTATAPSTANSITDYTVTVTDGNGCTDTDVVQVTVYSTPSVTVNKSDEHCSQQDGYIVVFFTDNTNRTQIEFSIDGGSTYSYNLEDITGSFIIENLSAGTYNLWSRWGDEDCPVFIQSVTLSNSPGISVVSSPNKSSCIREEVVISATASGGTFPYLYTWDNGLGNGQLKTVDPTTTTTYSVTATDNFGCIATTELIVTVLPATNALCSRCSDPADADNDGICASEDCDDNDPNLPAEVGTTCNDGNAFTINDEIQQDSCTCLGNYIPCSTNLNVTAQQPNYDDNGTPSNLSDDTFTFEIMITGNGNNWIANGQTGTYGQTVTFGPYAVDEAGVIFDVIDQDNPNCSENISVNISSCIYSGVCTCCN